MVSAGIIKRDPSLPDRADEVAELLNISLIENWIWGREWRVCSFRIGILVSWPAYPDG